MVAHRVCTGHVDNNIESAIVKGIDPIAVRCAYSDARDVVCVAYGATHQVQQKQQPTGK